MDGRVLCRHCLKSPAAEYRRGLCQMCHRNLEIRALYPSDSKYGRWADAMEGRGVKKPEAEYFRPCRRCGKPVFLDVRIFLMGTEAECEKPCTRVLPSEKPKEADDARHDGDEQ